jgi:signal transduction histidine kinase
MRLVTTAVPSIAASHSAIAWHPGKSGEYYQQAPENVASLLTGLTGVARLDAEGSAACWAFPISSPLAPEQVFLIVTGSADLSGQETFLLSVLAQLCGTVIAGLELIAAERERLSQVAALNAELEETVSALARLMEIHRRLTGIGASGGQAGIAATLHELTSYPVLIADALGRVCAAAGPVREDQSLAGDGAGPREAGPWEEIVGLLRTTRRAIYRGRAWLMAARPQADVLGVIALVDPARGATDTDLAALEYAATVLSVELARLHSVSEAELRGQADREREVAEARAAVLAVSEARQRVLLEELRSSRARLVAASDAARQRVTRDLHDGAQQRLVATLIGLQLAEQRWESAPQRARELLGQALDDTRRGIEDLRELAAGLHPAILTQQGLAPAVRGLADRVPIPVEIDVPGIRLPALIEASLYFLCSEALTNIVKHAHATGAWIWIEVAADQCVAEVRDDGIGGASPRPETSGLIGLSDRIGALGGTLDIVSPPSGGTVLRAAVPWWPGIPAE